MKKMIRTLACVSLLVLMAGSTAEAAGDKILNGVKIDQLDVSGMTRQEALKALEKYEKSLGEQSLHLGIGNHTLEAPLSKLGVAFDNNDAIDEALAIGRTGNIVRRYKDQKRLQSEGKDFPLSWSVDKAAVMSYVESNCTQFDQQPKNASLSRSNGKFDFVPGEQGIALDIEGSAQKIVSFLENDWTSETADDVLELPSEVTEPEGSAEQLGYITDLLGTFTTEFKTSGANRTKNVTSGASHINGTVLYPGEVFSTYSTVAPFTEANGYAMAGSYMNGEVVDSMGGGICQVSSTLYNAVIRAELEIVERYPHSMTVHYVALSDDAAIAGTSKDFKFKNNLDYPIYIEGYTTADKHITFNVFGKETRDPGRSVSFESVTVEEIKPTTVLTANPGAPIGAKSVTKGNTGYKAELHKIVKMNGQEVERTTFNRSNYKVTNRTVSYGTAGDPTWSENLRAAIAAQDEGLADANVAAASAAAAPPAE